LIERLHDVCVCNVIIDKASLI